MSGGILLSNLATDGAAQVAGGAPVATGAQTSTWVDPDKGSPYVPFSTPTRHKVRYFSGETTAYNVGTATAGLHYQGFSTLTVSGTASKPAFATTSKLAGTKRIRYAQTVASAMGIFESGYVNAGVAQFGQWRGNGAGRGGFYFRCRFAISSIGVSSLLHMFVGLTEISAPAVTFDWTTDTTASKIGIGFTATTSAGGAFPAANWKAIESAHSAPNLTDLGASFPLTVNDFLEVIMQAQPNDTKVTLIVNNLTTGATTGPLTLNTNLPPNTTPMLPIIQLGPQTITSGTNSIDLALWHIEDLDG